MTLSELSPPARKIRAFLLILLLVILAIPTYFFVDNKIYQKRKERLTNKIIRVGAIPTKVSDIFSDIEWNEFCRVDGYHDIETKIQFSFKKNVENFKYISENYFIEEGEMGIALINYREKKVNTYVINLYGRGNSLNLDIRPTGEMCGLREKAMLKVTTDKSRPNGGFQYVEFLFFNKN